MKEKNVFKISIFSYVILERIVNIPTFADQITAHILLRKIIHIDMDAFYASIEQRDNPDLKGKPVAVGRGKERGVVAAASYEARKYGIHSAMPSLVAMRKCPYLIFVSPRFDVYKEVSRQIREIFYEYTDLVEPLSLDEAYLDVTENKKGMVSASDIAQEIKKKIKTQTRLTASAGVSCNKFLAKIASDYRKPDGLFVIKPSQAERFVEQLPIEKFFGIGKVTAEKMRSMGIYTGLDLKQYDRTFLIKTFGKAGAYFYDVARGIDERPVQSNRVRKSIGVERTLENDITNTFGAITELYRITQLLQQDIDRLGVKGKTVTLKLKYHDFKQTTISHTFAEPVSSFQVLHEAAKLLLHKADLEGKRIRLMGLTLSNFADSANMQIRMDL